MYYFFIPQLKLGLVLNPVQQEHWSVCSLRKINPQLTAWLNGHGKQNCSGSWREWHSLQWEILLFSALNNTEGHNRIVDIFSFTVYTCAYTMNININIILYYTATLRTQQGWFGKPHPHEFTNTFLSSLKLVSQFCIQSCKKKKPLSTLKDLVASRTSFSNNKWLSVSLTLLWRNFHPTLLYSVASV